MFRKFIEGVIFGLGFILIIVLAWIAFSHYYVSSVRHSEKSYEINTTPEGLPKPKSQQMQESTENDVQSFHELSAEEVIKRSSIIALAKYEKAEDGKMKAIITEFLKKDANAKVYYGIGDEYTMSSYYPKENENRGDGLVIFFVGSSAQMRSAMSYQGERITGLSDIPIKLFREKCVAAPNP